MKEGWETKTLGEVCNIVNGGTPKSKVREYWNGRIDWLTPKDMGKLASKYVNSTPRKISEIGLTKSSAKLVSPMSVILSTRAPIGHLAINQVPMAFNQGCRGLVPKKLLDVHFLHYFLGANVDTLNELGTGTTFKELSATALKLFPIPLPPLAEQKRIVGVLDEAFAAIGMAVANAQKNLANARELFETTLNNIFTQKGEGWVEKTLLELIDLGWIIGHLDGNHGGDYPRKTEFINKGVPYISANCMKKGEVDMGLAKYLSAERAASLRKGIALHRDVLFAHNATVGPVTILNTNFEKVILGTSLTYYRCNTDFILPEYLAHYMKSPGFVAQYKSVMTQSTRNQVPITKQREFFHIIPPISEQIKVASKLDDLSTKLKRLEAIYQQKLDDLTELKQSILQKAFAGELMADNVLAFLKTSNEPVDTTSPAFAANVIAFGYARHVVKNRDKTYGRVKAQKNLHLIESIGDIDLGRCPQKDAAGPNDFAHMLRAEKWARAQQFFEFVQRPDGGYDFIKLPRYEKMKAKALAELKPYRDQLEKVTNLLIQMDTKQAEVFATIHTAWNNLIIDGVEISDEAIIHEARENWHPEKLNIPISKFKTALREIRQKNLIPDGTAKYVGKQQGDMF